MTILPTTVSRKEPGVIVLTWLMGTILLAAVTALIFFAAWPEKKVYEGDGKEVCSKNLSADDYQNCQVLISEGYTIGLNGTFVRK